MTAPRFMSMIDEYAAARRSLGFSHDARIGRFLRQFVQFARDAGHQGPITVDVVIRWVGSRTSSAPDQAPVCYSAVRGFAKYVAAFEGGTEVPPSGFLRRRYRRRAPHIFSDAEITDLLRAAAALPPVGGLRAHAYVTLFSLLASTGLRIGEALRLRCEDVDLRAGVLTIRKSKFRKDRLVPLDRSAIAPLRRYILRRARAPIGARSDVFILTDRFPRLSGHAVQAVFGRMRKQLGWDGDGKSRRPVVPDLRHTFAVRRLLRWYEDGVDAEARVPHLSTYLGHVTVHDTYWYLSGVPALLRAAARRAETLSLQGKGRAS
jgi:integrase